MNSLTRSARPAISGQRYQLPRLRFFFSCSLSREVRCASRESSSLNSSRMSSSARMPTSAPVLLMTGYAAERQRAHNLDVLIHDVITKPFTLRQICDAANEALAIHASPTTH